MARGCLALSCGLCPQVREVLTTALGPTTIGDLDDDFQTISPTSFNEEVVLPLQWRPGMACIWGKIVILSRFVALSVSLIQKVSLLQCTWPRSAGRSSRTIGRCSE